MVVAFELNFICQWFCQQGVLFVLKESLAAVVYSLEDYGHFGQFLRSHIDLAAVSIPYAYDQHYDFYWHLYVCASLALEDLTANTVVSRVTAQSEPVMAGIELRCPGLNV